MASSSPHPPSSPDILTGLPKDPSRGPPTPPPAYFPRQLPTMPFTNNNNPAANAHLAARFAGINLPLPPQHAVDAADLGWANLAEQHGLLNNNDDYDEYEDEQGSRSEITIAVSTAVRVRGDENIVCTEDARRHPAETARAVAEAVARAITREGAVPMIDEEGRPRPLRIEIDAGVEVRGEGNVLGGREVVMRALGRKRRRREETGEERGDDEGEESAPSRSRQRRQRPRSASV